MPTLRIVIASTRPGRVLQDLETLRELSILCYGVAATGSSMKLASPGAGEWKIRWVAVW